MVTETRDYCQLETFYAACSGGVGGSEDQLQVVSMLTARYGRMRQDGRCVKRDYGYVGCAADVLAHVDRLCSGRRVCDFPVSDLHGSQPCPNDLTPYLEASYECLSGTLFAFVIIISNRQRIRAQVPLYPYLKNSIEISNRFLLATFKLATLSILSDQSKICPILI